MSKINRTEAMKIIQSVDMARRRLDGEKLKDLAEEYCLSTRQVVYLIDKALSQALTVKLISPETALRKAELSKTLVEDLRGFDIHTLGALAQIHFEYLMDGDDFFVTEIIRFDSKLSLGQKELKGIFDYFLIAGNDEDWYAKWIFEHNPWKSYCDICDLADCDRHLEK